MNVVISHINEPRRSQRRRVESFLGETCPNETRTGNPSKYCFYQSGVRLAHSLSSLMLIWINFQRIRITNRSKIQNMNPWPRKNQLTISLTGLKLADFVMLESGPKLGQKLKKCLKLPKRPKLTPLWKNIGTLTKQATIKKLMISWSLIRSKNMELMWVRVFDSYTDCLIDYTPTLHVGLVLIKHHIKSRHGVWNTLVLGLQWFTFKTKEITNKVNILLLYFFSYLAWGETYWICILMHWNFQPGKNWRKCLNFKQNLKRIQKCKGKFYQESPVLHYLL